MADKGAKRGLGATDAGLKPGDYAVGSPQSRAAARALLERRFAGRIARTIIVDLGTDCTEPRIGEWREGADGSRGRVCALPDGMTMQEAERIVAARRKAIRDRRAGLVGIREAAENPGTLWGLSGD